MRTHRVSDVADQGISYSEIHTKLQSAEQTSHQAANNMQKSCDMALSSSHTVIVRGIPGLVEGRFYADCSTSTIAPVH